MSNKNILGFGKDNDSLAKTISITGINNNEVKTISIDELILYKKILKELKKFNMYLSILNNEEIKKIEVEDYIQKL